MKSLTLLLPICFLSSWLWFLLVLSLCTICFCNQNSVPVLCIPTERLALIDLKNDLTDDANRLSSWVGKDCCSWSGVVCDNITGHVHEIHLRGVEYESMFGGTISPSLIKLLQLRYLDLSNNDFGSISIPAFIGSFQNLIYLNLSRSNFSGEIPHQLGNLSTLRILDLHHNYDLHSKSLAWLKNLKWLQHLDMGFIDLAKASDWLRVVSNLTSLMELHLPTCKLNQLPRNPKTVGFTSLIVLDLSYNYYFKNSMLPGWIFSLSNLALLNLTHCFISGVNPGVHGGFHNMPSLRTLSVSHNTFMNSSSILNGLSSLSNLHLLDVSDCGISLPVLGNLQNLSLLEHVDLSSNGVVEKIPESLCNLCNITTLDLTANNFYGDVSALLERFCECESPKLELLAFGDNHLIGKLPERLGKLKNLIKIDLSYNSLTGTIPDSLGGLSSLIYMYLQENKLNGTIPDSIGGLSSLYSLYFASNSLTGILTENHFSNLEALENLSIGDNKLVFKLNVNDWIPPFKLKELSVPSCSLGPQFPSWIQSQTDLSYLDVANTNISDTIPNWFWTTVSSAIHLNMSHNNIHGMLPSNFSTTSLENLDLSNNNLSGILPGNFSTVSLGILDLSNNNLSGMLPSNFSSVSLLYLDLSNNNLSGSLDQFLCSGIQESRPLLFLNLANNNMSGVISNCWMNFQSLFILNVEKNQFSGIIPPSLGNISLGVLNMANNRLSGNLDPWLLNSKSLVIIELAENELTGKIPPSTGRDNTSLSLLSLRSNHFEGKIPDEICHHSFVQILDLAHNDLSGNLPKCFTNFSAMSGTGNSDLIAREFSPAIGTVSLVTKGNIYAYGNILYLVTTLDLSNNKFSGSIPDEFVGLLGLRFLNLSHNNLIGRIPNLFDKNGKLEALDLSTNHLEGNIPLSLAKSTTLSWLNVSYNNLVGRIPTGPQFQTFNESSFAGNALCGAPLPACLQNNGEADGTTEQHDESNGTDWILVILTLVGLVVGFWIVLTPLFFSRKWRIAYYRFLEEIWFKFENLIFLLFLSLRKRFRCRFEGTS